MTKRQKIIIIVAAVLVAAIIVGLIAGVAVLGVKYSAKNTPYLSGEANFEEIPQSHTAIRCYSDVSVFDASNVKLNYQCKAPYSKDTEYEIYLVALAKRIPYHRTYIDSVDENATIDEGSFVIPREYFIAEKGVIELGIYPKPSGKGHTHVHIDYEKKGDKIYLVDEDYYAEAQYKKDGSILKGYTERPFAYGYDYSETTKHEFMDRYGDTVQSNNLIAYNSPKSIFPIDEVKLNVSFGRLAKTPFFDFYDDGYKCADLTVCTYKDGGIHNEVLLKREADYDSDTYAVKYDYGDMVLRRNGYLFNQEFALNIPAEVFAEDYGELELRLYGYDNADYPDDRRYLNSVRLYYLKDIEDGREKIILSESNY